MVSVAAAQLRTSTAMLGVTLACVAVLLVGVRGQGGITPGPIVDTLYGRVQGNSVPMEDPVGVVYSYWNVPYARPPVGPLRFLPPQNPDAWEGTRYEETYGAACPGSKSLFLLTQPGFNNFNEDCLYLNVFTPDVFGSYPVFVWFHGGGYTSGGSQQYPGHFMARHGVVVVTVNYRLGHLGFLTTEDEVVPGNMGLYDQNLALQWVQLNIRAFGGNRDMVTIGGQSAGASSSSLHIISPESRGLFHRAVLESGADFSFWAINWPIQNPANYARQVATAHDCPTFPNQEMVDCLREVPWEILWNTSFSCTEGTFCQGMGPVIDGPGGFIPADPSVLRDQGNYNKVPIITGICREDGSLYTWSLLPDTSQGFNRSEFERNLRDNLLAYFTAYFPPEREEDVFEALNWYYSPWPHVDDEFANRDAFNHMITDAGFGYEFDMQAKHTSRDTSAYTYVFGFRSSNASNLVPEWMGVPHMGEIPYVWGYPLLQLNRDVRRDCNIIDIIDWNDEDIAYANYFMPMITNFIKFGNPTPEPMTPPTGGPGITWPVYEGAQRESMSLPYLYVDNVTNEVRYEYRQHAYSHFTEYLTYFAGHRFTPEGPIAPEEPAANAEKQKRRRLPKFPRSQIKRSPIPRKSLDSNAVNDAIADIIDSMLQSTDFNWNV